MNGTVALRYARSRKSTSDFDRAARQQQVIAALRQKALQLSTLTNPVKLTRLIDTLGGHVKTDMQPNEIAKMATLSKTLTRARWSKRCSTPMVTRCWWAGPTLSGAGYIEVPKAGQL
jgi:anionic cell wall polymer biosynthesis LytR-Cps2A-Psr (LCP) family protein